VFEHGVDDEIALRLLEPRHAEELFALTDANRGHLRPWMPWIDAIRSAADTRAFIEGAQRQFAANDGFQAGIRYRGRLVGAIGLHRVDWPNAATSIGYWLDRDHEGRGIATRACRSVLSIAFDELGLRRVEIRCAVENRRSRGIPERLGFRAEGTLRQAERVADRFVDHVVYALLAPEWRARPGKG